MSPEKEIDQYTTALSSRLVNDQYITIKGRLSSTRR